jgi:hypothetical protein
MGDMTPKQPLGRQGFRVADVQDHVDPPAKEEPTKNPAVERCADMLEEGYLYEPPAWLGY